MIHSLMLIVRVCVYTENLASEQKSLESRQKRCRAEMQLHKVSSQKIYREVQLCSLVMRMWLV